MMKCMSLACSSGADISRINSRSLKTWLALRQTWADRLDQKFCFNQNFGTKSKWRPNIRPDVMTVPGALKANEKGLEAILKADKKLRLTTPTSIPDRCPKNEALGTRTCRENNVNVSPFQIKILVAVNLTSFYQKLTIIIAGFKKITVK